MEQKMTMEELGRWLLEAKAVEVDSMFVIYPPSMWDDEISLIETPDGEVPHFVITEDCEITLDECGSVTAINKETDETVVIARLMPECNVHDQSSVYAFKKGNKCPKCQSENLHAASGLDHCANRIYQECICNDCGWGFTDVYTLTGYEGLTNEND